MDVLMAIIDLKVVSRVLRMKELSEEKLHWCEHKMSKLLANHICMCACTFIIDSLESAHGQVIEKKLISMTREMEKLCTEIASAEKRQCAPANPANEHGNMKRKNVAIVHFSWSSFSLVTYEVMRF
ncbi:hypothetical protein S245_059240, partial [Arachis hypogaea]